MRNLKRALSLALASVMLLGMMVVGTSAASYPDVDENDNVEAIEVLNAVSVMIGDRGNFRPDAAVNRHEMATIMAKLVLGVETADNYVGTHPFTDVFPWADKYVAACYENGLVAGTSATTFGGNQPLTAVQAAAMMLRALGYKDLSKGATDWRAPVTAMANQIRLFDGVASNPSEQLTRNQVAQLALNTLKSPMVNLKDNTISWSNDEGQIIMTGGSREYIALSSNEAYAKAINDTEKAGTSASQIAGFTVELGEHLYNGKLKLNNNYLDVFGRPARHWEFDGKEIGSYIKEELMVMDNVGKVTGNDLYSLLGASTIKDYDTLVTIDGVANDRSDAKDILGYPNGAYFDEADMNRNNKAAVGKTGTGVLTQVFVDHEKDEVYVAVINTYLARADRDYDDKSEEATLTVYGIDEYRTEKEYVKLKGNNETMKVQAEDFIGLETIKKDDPFLVTVADGEIQTMAEDEVLEGVTLTAFKKGDHVVSDGTEYAYTTTATYDSATLDNYTGIDGSTNLKDISYNIYLDAYGNLIGIKEIDAVKNYVFLAGIDVDGSNLYSKTATANALFLDGTTKTIKINLAKSKWTTHPALNNTNVVISGDALLNTWCTYTVSSDNVYTVTEAYATRVNPDHPSIEAINANPNNYPGGGDNKTKLAQSWQPAAGLNEDNYTVDVKRMRLHGTTNNSDGSAYANVYGDSTSVYLTANLDELFNDQPDLNKGYNYGIIKDVDAVTTGVADVSIKVMTKEAAQKAADDAGKLTSRTVGDCAYGIYTLYDSDGIVIASVVIGEDDGVKDLVYVHTSTLDLESYDSSADTWTWTRKVVFNGQETTLTEKGSELSELKEMTQFHWYEIKRNADGNVINVEPAWSALDDAFVYEYSKINTTVETINEDTVLYQTEDGPLPADDNGAVTGHDHYGFYKEKLNVIGTNTLAVETLTGSGIHFRDNVNVVLQYWNRNTEQTEIETGTGVDRLKSMVDFVNKNTETRDSAHPYYLSAVIEKGFATTIVIYDSFNSYNRPEASLGNYELTLGGVLNSIYTTPANENSDVYLVDAAGNITYVESNDSVATSTVNGYKRYTIPYDRTVRIYDNNVGDANFVPFFSPVWAVVGEKDESLGYNWYYIGRDSHTGRTYLEFSISERLTDNKLTVRERLDTDGIYVGVVKDSKATVTINGKAWDAVTNCSVVPGLGTIRVKADKGASVYVNGKLLTPDAGTTDTYTFQAAKTDRYIIISTTGGSVTPDTYTVTVAKTANGSASVDKSTGLEGGETITVTTTPDEGYELDTISVDGTAIEGNTFTMPKKDVIVTVTFKATVSGIKFEGGSAEKDTDFTVTKNADGSYTIKAVDTTLGVKVYEGEGYTVTGAGAEWTVTPKAGTTDIVVKINKFEWTVVTDAEGNFGLKAVEVMPKSLARARVLASEPIISSKAAGDGFMKISFTGIEALAGKSYVVKQETRMTANGEVSALWFGKNLTEADAKELAEALTAAKGDFKVSATTNVTDEEKDAWAGDTPAVSEIMAIVNEQYDNSKGGYNVTKFTQYIPASDKETELATKLTAPQVAAALAKATGKTFVESKVILKDKVATAEDGTKYILPSTTCAPTRVWKVTYNTNKTFYLEVGTTKNVTDVAEGVKYLIDGSKNADSSPLTVTEGAVTFPAPTKDVTYVPAVALQGTITSGQIKTAVGAVPSDTAVMVAEVVNPATGDMQALATGDYVKVGAQITLSKLVSYNLATGASIGVKVNDKTNSSVAIKGAGETAKITVANNEDSTLTLVAVVNAVSNDVTVTLDGKTMKVNKDEDDPSQTTVTLTGLRDSNDKPYSVIAKSGDGYAKVLDGATENTAGSNGQMTALLSALGTPKDGKIELFTGYKIDQSISAFTVLKALKAAGANRDEAIDVSAAAVYLPANTPIYVQGGAGDLLTTKSGKEELAGTRYDDGKSISTSKYAYATTLTSDLANDSFKPLVQFEADVINATVGGRALEMFAGDKFDTTTIVNTMIKVNKNAVLKDITVDKFALTGGDFNGLTTKDFKWEITGADADSDAASTLQFTITNPKYIEKTKVSESAYNMEISINGLKVGVAVTIDARTATNQEKVDSAKALLANFDIPGSDPAADETTVKSAVKDKVTELLTATYSGLVTANATTGHTDSGYKWGTFTPAVNGTSAANTDKADKPYTVGINLKSADPGSDAVEEQVEITVTIKGLPFAETKNGIVKAAEDAVKELTALSANAADYASAKTAFEARVNAALPKDSEGDAIATATVDWTDEATDYDASAKTIKGKVTISYSGTSGSQFELTLTIPDT